MDPTERVKSPTAGFAALSATLGATLLFARLFEMPTVTELFQRAFLVQFLFETPKCTVNGLTALYANFS
jgi:hypothetical protein